MRIMFLMFLSYKWRSELDSDNQRPLPLTPAGKLLSFLVPFHMQSKEIIILTIIPLMSTAM